MCLWKEGTVHVPNYKSFLVTEAERKHVRRSARFQQHGDASCHQVFFFCKARRRRKFSPFWQKHLLVSFLVGLRTYQYPCNYMYHLLWHETLRHSPTYFTCCGPGSSVGIATDYGLDGPGSDPGGDEISRPSRPALGPTQSPVKWVPVLSPGVKCGRVMFLTTHALLVPRSWKSRAIPLPTLWAAPGL